MIVWICDNRTASGKGVESTWPVYKHFGELELRDLEDGLKWLTSQPYVDGSRVVLDGCVRKPAQAAPIPPAPAFGVIARAVVFPVGAYGSLVNDRRRSLHARIVAAIAQLAPDRPGSTSRDGQAPPAAGCARTPPRAPRHGGGDAPQHRDAALAGGGGGEPREERPAPARSRV